MLALEWFYKKGKNFDKKNIKLTSKSNVKNIFQTITCSENLRQVCTPPSYRLAKFLTKRSTDVGTSLDSLMQYRSRLLKECKIFLGVFWEDIICSNIYIFLINNKR